MSTYDLFLWKAPVVSDADEAARLLEPYYDREDDSAFHPSAAVATVSNELLRRFPDARMDRGRMVPRKQPSGFCISQSAGERTTPSSMQSPNWRARMSWSCTIRRDLMSSFLVIRLLRPGRPSH